MQNKDGRKIRMALGCDHAGFSHKEAIKHHLLPKGIECKDFGTFSEDSVDYPEFVLPAAKAVAEGNCDLGIVLGGSGNGEAIAANKVRGVRCALCWSEETARLAKEHNDANVISIGQRQITLDLAIKMVDTWLNASFEGDRHIKRIQMLDSYQ
ncbi:MAG: ribose-5-phosphate isomerase [Verrucomicrobiota bacterium]|nr:ribose-5-phosphate isomerase [Verrucomicrobiota bacterium]